MRRFLTLLTFSFPLLPVVAQEIAAPVFREAVDVRVVNLEVVVTDQRGHRVNGLVPEDFKLFVDDAPVTIDYFTEVVEGRASSPESGGTSPALSSGEEVGRSYVVFIDEFFSMPNDRDEVVRSVMSDLPRLGPADRMAIVAWDGHELALLTHWSSSRDHLRGTLERAILRPAHGRERQAEQRPVASPQRRHSIGASPGGQDLDLDAMPDVESMRDVDLQMAVRRLEEQMTAATAAAAAALRSFADAPGRKVMLLLSGGWPQSPAEMIAENAATELSDHWIDREDVFGRLSAAANRLGFTIYPVDVPDSTLGFGLVSANEQDVTPSEGIARGTDLRRGSQLRHTLELLASRTGGKTLVGSDRRAALTLVSNDTNSYYWLGFTPTWNEDDEAREIRVEVMREGLTVRSRSTYLDLSRQRSVSMLLESALLYDQNPRGHTLPVKIDEPKRSRRQTVEIQIRVAIPTDSIVFVPSGDRFVADLALHLALRDDEGRQIVDLAPVPFQVRIKENPKPGTYVGYDTKVKLRNRPHRVVVAIEDLVGGAALTGVADFKP